MTCAAVLAVAALAPHTASADSGSPTEAAQSSSSSASSTAQNDNTTIQSATQTQTGDSGQSQSTIQVAPTQQSANAAARSNQGATNVASGGTATQRNTSSASGAATNANATNQSSAQQQESSPSQGAPAPDPSPSAGQSQTTSQSAPTSQHADATAASNQVAPTNINISIRVDSPGDNGPVEQNNTSTATAVSGNSNSVAQDGSQAQTGGRSSSGQSQSAGQNAPTSQDASAASRSTQVAPTNLNITIRNKSPGEDGAVSQTNTSQSTAGAANSNDANQDAAQVQDDGGASGARSILGGNGTPHTYIPRGHTSYPPPAGTTQPASTSQSQTAMQSAPTTQTADGTATSLQTAPTNGDVAVSVDKDASDPNGSGRHGTLIQIWIPRDEPTSGSSPKGEATQTNSTSANAAAVNSNQTTQAADQRQTARSGGDTQVGGASQAQVVEQSAPTRQSGTADAISAQQGGVNLAAGGGAAQTSTTLSKATVANSNQMTQTAVQIQDGGLAAGGSQSQVIEQTAPTTQIAIAQTLSSITGVTNVGDDGWSVQTNVSSSTAVAGKSTQTTQSAEQIQLGTTEGRSQVQVIEQSVASAVRLHTQGACGRRCASGSAAALQQDLTVWSSSTGSDTSRPTNQSGAGKNSPQRPPRDGDGRLPQEDKLPGAAAGASSSSGGGSLWVFAALLIPFALTAPWWARRHGPAALRRLTGVVVRPERPG
jgi:hypothetical protein